MTRPEPCSTCGGSPHASGLACVCGGTNLASREAQGLREEVFRLQEEIRRLREALRAAANVIASTRLAFPRSDPRYQESMAAAQRFHDLIHLHPTEPHE